MFRHYVFYGRPVGEPFAQPTAGNPGDPPSPEALALGATIASQPIPQAVNLGGGTAARPGRRGGRGNCRASRYRAALPPGESRAPGPRSRSSNMKPSRRSLTESRSVRIAASRHACGGSVGTPRGPARWPGSPVSSRCPRPANALTIRYALPGSPDGKECRRQPRPDRRRPVVATLAGDVAVRLVLWPLPFTNRPRGRRAHHFWDEVAGAAAASAAGAGRHHRPASPSHRGRDGSRST